MTSVKICGIMTAEDAECLNACRPEMAGFVFYPPSKRCISLEEAKMLRDRLDPGIKTVGVFVDEDPRTISAAVDSGAIDIVQLHGNEDNAYIHGIRRMTGAPIIKAFVLGDERRTEDVESCDADLVLLDAGKGSGMTFDWSLAHDIGRDYILSGGLTPENVKDAVSELSPFGIDVSSGVETDRKKDPKKIRRFIDTVRSPQ